MKANKRSSINGPHPMQAELRADCARCFGLCCAALPFAASADFAADKDAGTPCPNLKPDFRCGIHGALRESGYRGCTVYDCFGAGQHVSGVTYGGRDWRSCPDTAAEMFAVFPAMRHLFELLWYLTDALNRTEAADLHSELAAALEETRHLTLLPPEELLAVDITKQRDRVNSLLLPVSERVRAAALSRAPRKPGKRRTFGRGADLIGAKLKGADLTGAFLRGACLIGADLRGASLDGADVIGADFRDADLRGADVSGSLFLTAFQVASARGDAATRLPSMLDRPAHWNTAACP